MKQVFFIRVLGVGGIALPNTHTHWGLLAVCQWDKYIFNSFPVSLLHIHLRRFINIGSRSYSHAYWSPWVVLQRTLSVF